MWVIPSYSSTKKVISDDNGIVRYKIFFLYAWIGKGTTPVHIKNLYYLRPLALGIYGSGSDIVMERMQ